MKILLTKDVSGLGRAGDVKEVTEGYARNFLIPKHLALPATTSMLTKIQKEEQERQAKISKQQQVLKQLKEKLINKVFTIKAKSSKEHLFAAVKEAQIATAINDKLNLDIRPDQIVIKTPLKSLGLHEAEIRFAESAKAMVRLNVEAIEN